MSEQQAQRKLADYLSTDNPYDVSADCLSVRSLGYKNVGYTLQVVSRCDGGHALGQWRVDSKTGEIFRQGSDGRYLKP